MNNEINNEVYHYYFAYGMNTDPSAMQHRTGQPMPHGRAILRGYEFRFAMHADVVPSPTQVVHGVLWSITDEQLASLDIREGYPSYYDRKMLDIECAYISGGKCKAWTYFMTPGQQEFPPGDHYWNMLMSGYTYFNVPTAQMFKAVNRCKHLDYHANEHQYYKKRREIVNSYRNVA